MVSIIIVNYKTEREIYKCIESIQESEQKVDYEIIVVDNDEESKVGNKLKEKFKEVKYIKSPGNLGYGGGNNLGILHSRGDFLFFLNPDTIVKKNAISMLVAFLKTHEKAGIVAPLFLDPRGKIYPSQGSEELTPLSAVFSLSFINKLLPNNPVSRHYFLSSWDKKNPRKVGTVPGTAFLIRKSLFEKAGKFDENFFLYFEEFDLCKRVRKLGYELFILPESQIIHYWGVSTNRSSLNVKKIFSESRFYYFKKHYGLFRAILVQLITGFSKIHLFLILILILSLFLRLYKLQELMSFIGDQGWFYLSARDILINGEIPLVGVPSSRPWLHQGPLWTYLLVPFFWVFNFNPVSGAYLSIFFGILSVLGIYLLGATLFSKRTGLTSSLLYATSPLVVFHSRFPYHTSPIPFFVIVFIFSLHKIIKNKIIYFPISIFSLSILYNFEIATVILGVVLVLVLGYKLFKKEINIAEILNKKIIYLSIAAFVIPMMPMILHDVKNGFPQTLKFGIWFFYRIASFFGYNPEHAFSVKKITIMLNFIFESFTKLIFASSNNVSLFLFIALFGWAVYFFTKKSNRNISRKLVLLLFFLPLLLIIFNQTPSDAYLPMLLPTTVLLVSAFFGYLSQIKKMLIPTFAVIIFMVLTNVNFMLRNNFSFDKSSNTFTLSKRIQASKEILNLVKNEDYKLEGVGQGSEHESFTMNYEYLTWWLGHGPSRKSVDRTIIISESKNGINVRVVNR